MCVDLGNEGRGSMENQRSAVTVMKGKSVALLELDYSIISIIPNYKSPWGSDVQNPGEIFVLLGKLIMSH